MGSFRVTEVSGSRALLVLSASQTWVDFAQVTEYRMR